MVKNLPAKARDISDPDSIPSQGWEDSPSQLTQVLLSGESHGQRRVAGYRPWGCKESDMAEVTARMCRVGRTITLSSNSVKQEETTHPANTSKCYKETCLFTEQRIRDKNLMRHCNHKFASDDLQDKSHHPACPRYLRM